MQVLEASNSRRSHSYRLCLHPLFGNMLRPPSAHQLYRKRVKSVSSWYRLTWIVGYLGLAVAALSSTLLIPVLLSTFRSNAIHSEPYKLQKQGKSDGLTWTQETVPHLSRTMKSKERQELVDLNKKLWKPAPNQGFKPCITPTKSYSRYNGSISRGYLVVHANGGLNQMRAGICDMVAVARLTNATLVIPDLDKRSFWQDSSNFSDVFDEEYFIKALERDVPVVKKLPKEMHSARKIYKQFRSWSTAKYYQEVITKLWDDYKIIRAPKSDSRLANNDLPSDIQKLRCRVHYDALRFAPPIEALGKKLLERMRSDGPFIALHLRYEKDMLAFSGCTYGLTQSEIEELTAIRESIPHWRVKVINSTEQRSKGLCPLTPKEVGIFLQALGYLSTSRIYIAAGEIYGGDGSMAELRSRFPNLMCKETIATSEELAPFSGYASQMAALDYIVSVESDVFIPSYSGNMARAVEGHRRFLGHRRTISPDRKRLVGLFDELDKGLLQKDVEFSGLVIEMHRKRQGAPRKRKGPIQGSRGRERYKSEEAFYTNPLPDCLCQKQSVTVDARKPVVQRGSGNSSLFSTTGHDMDRPHILLDKSLEFLI